MVEGLPEYEVTVANGCGACPQNGVRVSCPAGGVQSVEPADESKIRADEAGLGLVNDAMPVAKGSPVTIGFQVFTLSKKLQHGHLSATFHEPVDTSITLDRRSRETFSSFFFILWAWAH